MEADQSAITCMVSMQLRTALHACMFSTKFVSFNVGTRQHGELRLSVVTSTNRLTPSIVCAATRLVRPATPQRHPAPLPRHLRKCSSTKATSCVALAPCATTTSPTMAGQVRQPIDIASLERYVAANVPEIQVPLDVKQVMRRVPMFTVSRLING
jgi:hypothetical protein